MGIVSALLGLLGWLRDQIPGIVLGLFLLPVLAKFGGSQASYLYSVAISPRHWPRLMRGFSPCPVCGGSGIERIAGGIQAQACMGCFAESMPPHGRAPYGYVSFGFLRREWDWKHWERKPLPIYAPIPARRPTNEATGS